MIVGVAGASGNVGTLVVQKLLVRDDISHVIALSRRSIEYSDTLPRQPTQRRIDYKTVESLLDAFSDLDTLVFPGSDGDPDEMLLHHRNVVSAVSKCKVRRVVYLSTQSPAGFSQFPYARVHHATEELLQSSGAVVSVLRASIFSEFFIQSFVQPAIAKGALYLPTPTGSVAFVSRIDAANTLAAAVAITSRSSTADVTGPESLSMMDVVAIASDVTHKELQFEPITEQRYRTKLVERHYDPWLIEAFTTMMSSSIPSQCFQNVSAEVFRLTGSEPQSFSDVLSSILNK